MILYVQSDAVVRIIRIQVIYQQHALCLIMSLIYSKHSHGYFVT